MGLRDIIPRQENSRGKKLDNEMEAGGSYGFVGFRVQGLLTCR